MSTTETHKSIWGYIDYVASICSKFPEKAEVLILGLGGGAFADIFQNNLGFNVDAVELDERDRRKLRAHYFALGNNVNIIVDDARHYLEETQKKYDLIFFDVYRGELPSAACFYP